MSTGRPLPANALRARAGLKAGDPQAYSRFVAVMKRVLLFAALALILAVVAYSLQPRESSKVSMIFAKLGHIANDLAMIRPKLHGTDADGDPFVVTADRAVQDGATARKATLYNVQADLSVKKSGAWITVSARRGYLNADKNTLQLTGDVSLFSDSGYELHTASARADLATGRIEGDAPLRGQGPGGTLKADRFVFDRQGKIVHLSGNVQMSFFVNGDRKH